MEDFHDLSPEEVTKRADDLFNQLSTALSEVDLIEINIRHLQKNCRHNWHFLCRGPYEDTYRCEYCQLEKEV